VTRLLLAFAIALPACGPIERAPARIATSKGAIVGGMLDAADPQVFELEIVGDNHTGSYCTATLIDRRTLLTAAHCVDPRTVGAQSVTLRAMNLANDSAAGSSDYLKVTESRFHPAWNLNTLDNDIGLALLEVAPAVTPKPWNAQSVSAMSGLPLRAVGYGTTGIGGAGAGLRREVALTFRQVTAAKIFLGDQAAMGICHGDSGGPSLHTFPDGIERVVGVHSYTLDQNCLDGADTRVDAQADFIQQWIDEKEAASCGEDGRCKMGCAPVDLDCVCGLDGACTTDCPNLLKDPDCPKDCIANSICSVKACPVPDIDCAVVGHGCNGPLQCVSRMCVSDPQHLAYCSQGCVVSADCPAHMECDATQICRFKQLPLVSLNATCNPDLQACGPGRVCSGRTTADTRCAKSCYDERDCDAEQLCVVGADNQKFCGNKPDVVLPLAKLEEKAAPAGCASVPGSLGLLCLLALKRQRRKR
jgi:hypothetical protein